MDSIWEREKIAEQKDADRVISRANEIAGGAKLRVDAYAMEQALVAFLRSVETWHHFRGDTRDYLQKTGVTTLYATPWCSDCDMKFRSERGWASHMMSYKHAVKKLAPGAFEEVRAHIHAFPIDKDDFGSFDSDQILERYKFRNLRS